MSDPLKKIEEIKKIKMSKLLLNAMKIATESFNKTLGELMSSEMEARDLDPSVWGADLANNCFIKRDKNEDK